MRRILKFKGLYTKSGWLSPAWVEVDTNGFLLTLSNQAPLDSIAYEHVAGYALPGFINGHSHAFQYAMAGLAEVHPSNQVSDNFWSWRELMYKIALQVNPDQLRHIATMLYAEMLRHGYTHVVEFHYLHNDTSGARYDNPAEMAFALISAAGEANIGITMVPMLYQQGGFEKPAEANQKRFLSKTIEDYQEIVELVRTKASQLQVLPGWGIHSLRAVTPDDIPRIVLEFDQQLPFHMHISEQIKEVEDFQKIYGMRPINWLTNNIDLSGSVNLVHATHMDSDEVRLLAESDSRVIICPTTEGNLGDGIFPHLEFCTSAGNWTIGTDSHIGLSPFEELRLLDYGQRLITHQRNIFSGKSEDSGENAFRAAVCQGRLSAGLNEDNFFDIGNPFDAIVIDEDFPIISASEKGFLSKVIYSGDPSILLGTLKSGEWIVKDQKHQNHSSFKQNFKSVIADLGL